MKILTTLSIALFLFFISAASYASDCASDKEKIALDSRALQSQLMVAALSCRQTEKYNSFMAKFKEELISHSNDLKAYFSRLYKAKSTNKLNQFITELANESSKRSLQIESDEFCKTNSKLFDKLMKVKPGHLYELASDVQFSSLHGVKNCNIKSAKN